jgi:hypothetical protein
MTFGATVIIAATIKPLVCRIASALCVSKNMVCPPGVEKVVLAGTNSTPWQGNERRADA